MNKPMAGVLAALLAVSATRAEGDKDVTTAIEALNKAFHKGDARAVKALMTDDHVAVTPYYGGAQTRDEQVKSLSDLKLSEYKAGKMTVKMLGKEAALVTYPLTLKGTYKGKDVPPKSFASAVWVKKGGKWLEAFYQETRLDEK